MEPWMLGLPLALPLQAVPQDAPRLPMNVPCVFDAWLECPGGRIEFRLAVEGTSAAPRFALLNGAHQEDRTPIERFELTATGLALHIDSYDSHLEFAALDDLQALHGTWRKRRDATQWAQLPVGARLRPNVPPGDGLPVPPPPRELDGRWAVKFASDDDPAVGIFAWPYVDTLSGTFLTTLGDYRYLAGGYDKQSSCWKLSCFDGAHAFLFVAKLREDGSIAGDFWSGDAWHESWSAQRDERAQLPDPFGLTKINAGVDLAQLVFTAPDGGKLSLADPRFAGKGRILQLFGTWCPNCNDEAEYLRELDERYRARGLSIVGLGFEITGDPARDLGQLARFATRHGVKYPLLLAGKSDKAEASKAFPLLDQVRAFPTTLFLRADGSVLAVHQGYAGPATGAAHVKLRQDFERLVDELLSDKPAPRR